MRTPARGLVVGCTAALFSLASSSASAFALEVRLNPASDGVDTPSGRMLGPSDVALVDVYLDADPGLQVLSVAVRFDDAWLAYAPASTAVPSYVLYTPAVGPTPSSYLVPVSDPPNEWLGTNVPGKRQVMLEYAEASLGTTLASGTEIWIGTIALHAQQPETLSFVELQLAMTGPGPPRVHAFGNDVTAETTVTGTVRFGYVPEPGAAWLVASGFVALVALERRRTRRGAARVRRSARAPARGAPRRSRGSRDT